MIRQREAANLRPFAAGSCAAVNPPAIPGLGITAGFQIWIEQKGAGNYGQLAEIVDKIIAKARTRPEILSGVNTTIRANGQQLLADVDREKAEVLGVPIQDAYGTLQTMFGSLYVSQFPKDSRLYQVVLQAEPQFRLTPEDIGRFYVKNTDGEMVPLSALVNTKYVVGPDLVTRFNNYPAIAINGSPARASVRVRRSRPSARWSKKTLPPATATTGPAKRARKSAPAPRRRSHSCSA